MPKDSKIEIRLSEELKNEIQTIAKKQNTTVSQIVRQQIEHYIKESELKKCEETILLDSDLEDQK